MTRAAVVAFAVLALAMAFSMELRQGAMLAGMSGAMAWVLERVRR